MKCPSCGTENMEGSLFCDECGASLTETAAAPAAPIPTPAPEAPAPPAPIAAPEAPTVTEAPEAPTPEQRLCPSCQHPNLLEAQFCEECGASLAEVALAPAPAAPPAVAKLVVAVSGAELPLDFSGKTEILLGRTDPVSQIYPEVDLTPHGGFEGGVSRRHCRIMMQGEQFFIEDLDSTNGTKLNNQFIRPRTPHPIKDGDQIQLGEVTLGFWVSG